MAGQPHAQRLIGQPGLHDPAEYLVQRKIGCLPVVQDGRLVGIVTENDFVAMVARKSR